MSIEKFDGLPLVSVIVPTRNSGSTLAVCLQSIRKQTYSNIELIVVDNYSVDSTCDIAAKFGAEFFLIGPERCTQVNFGVSKARGKYAYRVDSDFVLEPGVVAEAVECCEKYGYDAVAVHNTSDPTVSFWARVRKMERDSYRNGESNISARFWNKHVFESIGGFDVNLVAGDDYDLQNRLVKSRYRVGRITSNEIHIGEPKNLRDIFLKHYYYGQNIGHFIDKDQRRAMVQLSPFRSSVLRNFSSSYKEPALLAGFLLYQILRYSAAGLGYILH